MLTETFFYCIFGMSSHEQTSSPIETLCRSLMFHINVRVNPLDRRIHRAGLKINFITMRRPLTFQQSSSTIRIPRWL